MPTKAEEAAAAAALEVATESAVAGVDETADGADVARKAAAHDAKLRAENPDQPVIRKPFPGEGGTSFTYGPQ